MSFVEFKPRLEMEHNPSCKRHALLKWPSCFLVVFFQERMRKKASYVTWRKWSRDKPASKLPTITHEKGSFLFRYSMTWFCVFRDDSIRMMPVCQFEPLLSIHINCRRNPFDYFYLGMVKTYSCVFYVLLSRAMSIRKSQLPIKMAISEVFPIFRHTIS